MIWKQALVGVRFGVLSTYPSTQCGIATFAEALVLHLQRTGAHVGVVRVVDERQQQTLPVVHQWVTGRRDAVRTATAALNSFDVVLVQHEYGIFGGEDGSDVVDVVSALRVPVISVLHTVLSRPTQHQYEVLAELCARSAALVTMTETARQRLVSLWGVDPARVTVITHGAEHNLAESFHGLSSPPTILTWGLLGEGKGIEWALQALAQLRDVDPFPTYRIVGQTHPRVLERDGEAYRDRLVALADELGLSSSVEFVGHYLPGPELRAIVRSADVILLPYDSRDQVTSGVLTEAVAAGKPVVSTSFPHAVELLGDGTGLLAPQADANALAAALRRVLTEDGLAAHMAGCARARAASLLWPAVAAQYVALGRSLAMARPLSVA
jgi:glycosyltransferase involved in cell wall biosynthesis